MSPLASTVAWTVMLSVVAHGLTAGALASRYGRWIATRQATTAEPLPELEERSELRPSTRSTWVRRGNLHDGLEAQDLVGEDRPTSQGDG